MKVMTKEEETRFRAKTKRGKKGCIQWDGAKLWSGYGVFTVAGKRELVHRLATRRALRTDQHVYHSCGNKLCVNPEHLHVGANPVEAFMDAAKKFVAPAKRGRRPTN